MSTFPLRMWRPCVTPGVITSYLDSFFNCAGRNLGISKHVVAIFTYVLDVSGTQEADCGFKFKSARK